MRSGAERLVVRAEMVGSSMSAVFSRLSLPWRGIGAVIVGVLLARWTWILFAPHTLAVLPARLDAGEKVSDALFGIVAASGVAKANGDAALGNMHLVGVFTGKHGFAVLKMDEKTQRGVALGEEVISGVKLVDVDVDHVVLDHNGLRQRLNLESKPVTNKSTSLAHPSTPSAQQAVEGWNQAHQEMQGKKMPSNVHQ